MIRLFEYIYFFQARYMELFSLRKIEVIFQTENEDILSY